MSATRKTLLPEPAGMRDFWEAYEERYDDITKDLLALCAQLPALSAVLKRLTPEQMEEQDRVSRGLLRRAAVDGDWAPLLANQREQGGMYAAMGVSFAEWFEICSAFQKKLVPALVSKHLDSPDRLAGAVIAMNTYIDIAMSAIGDEYLRTKERIITQQQEAIQELSTPVLQIRDRMLLVPLVGVLDTQRARFLTEQLLNAIRTHRAKVVVMDITGVPAVDSKVANHILQTVAAARLMGARCVVTGLSSDVAQALVALGVDLDRLNTVGDLQGGLEEAERLLGYRMSATDETQRLRITP